MLETRHKPTFTVLVQSKTQPKILIDIMKFQGESDYYDKHFECLPCADGCDVCEDKSPCVITLNWTQRSVVLAVSALIMCCIPALIWFTVQYRDIKVTDSQYEKFILK